MKKNNQISIKILPADQIPPGWSCATVQELIDESSIMLVQDGNHGGDYPQKDDFADHGIPLIRGNNLINGTVDLSDCLFITEKKANSLRIGFALPGDVLLTHKGTIGKTAIVPHLRGYEYIVLNPQITLYRVSNSGRIDYRFLKYFFDAPAFQKFLNNVSGMSTISTLSLVYQKSIELFFPPLPEQRAIAEVLSALDEKIELNRRMNQTLEELAQALFKHWFVDNPDREGWEEKTIGEILPIVGGSTPSTTNPAFWDNGKFNWATPKDLSSLLSPILLNTERKITEKGLEQISSGLLPIGTVLLSSRAPVGYLAIAEIPVAINQGFIAIKPTPQINMYFILNWLQKNIEEIKARANGTTFQEISKSNFRPMVMKIPPEPIMKQFENCVAPIYSKISINLHESRTLAELRDTLLPKLMSGQVRVR